MKNDEEEMRKEIHDRFLKRDRKQEEPEKSSKEQAKRRRDEKGDRKERA